MKNKRTDSKTQENNEQVEIFIERRKNSIEKWENG